MRRKIIKIGNSSGIIIPSPYLKEIGVSYPDEVEVEYNKELQAVTIRNIKTTPDDNYLEQVIKGVVDSYLREKGL